MQLPKQRYMYLQILERIGATPVLRSEASSWPLWAFTCTSLKLLDRQSHLVLPKAPTLYTAQPDACVGQYDWHQIYPTRKALPHAAAYLAAGNL